MITEKQLRPYVGMPYRSWEFDCADFVVYLMREFFDRDVELPSNRPRGPKACEQLETLSKPYGTVTCEPVDGDFVLMFDLGDTMPTHVGVYVELNGEAHVFHCAEKTGGSVLHPIRRLAALGLRIEGFYKWMDH